MTKPAYDQSGQWPINADGWQVLRIGKALFPGGPAACQAVSPAGSFYFGINFEPASGPVCRAVITSFGINALGPVFHYVLVTPDAIAKSQGAVRSYLLEHAARFHFRRFDAVEFRLGDGAINEIF